MTARPTTKLLAPAEGEGASKLRRRENRLNPRSVRAAGVRLCERSPSLGRGGALTGPSQSLNHQRIALLQQDPCRESHTRLLE